MALSAAMCFLLSKWKMFVSYTRNRKTWTTKSKGKQFVTWRLLDCTQWCNMASNKTMYVPQNMPWLLNKIFLREIKQLIKFERSKLMTLSDDKSVNAGLRSQRKILFDAIVFHCRSEILDFDTINQIWGKISARCTWAELFHNMYIGWYISIDCLSIAIKPPCFVNIYQHASQTAIFFIGDGNDTDGIL